MLRKEEKGSVTLFVLIVCMFMIVILLVVNISIMNKKRTQEKDLEEITKQYNQNETDLNNEYAKIANENNYLTEIQIKELMNEMKLEMYPVGSIYITTNEQNPSEYLGGEWEGYGEGRTIVGAGTGTDSNNVQKVFEINETGGEYQHSLTINEMPSHSHYYSTLRSAATNYHKLVNSGTSYFSWAFVNLETSSEGGEQPHNNVQPYIATYIWKRIS